MLTSFDCLHCDRNLLAGEDLQYAIFLYGIFLLEGKDDGYVGTTCPSCRKTTHLHLSRQEFNALVDMCEFFNFQGVEYHKPLEYFYPYENWSNIPASKTLRYNCVIRNIEEGASFEQDINFYESENILDEEIFYRSYIENLTACTSNLFRCVWIPDSQINELLTLEQDSNDRIFPRYIFNNELINTVEEFCLEYRQSQKWAAEQQNKVVDLKQELGEEYANFVSQMSQDDVDIIEGPGAYGMAEKTLNNIEQHLERDVKKVSAFHDILTSDPDVSHLSKDKGNLLRNLHKKRYPFSDTSPTKPFHISEDDYNKKDAKHYLEVCQNLKKCFNKEYSQKFLLDNADKFIDEYLAALEKASWAYADLWSLTTRFLDRYDTDVKYGQREEANYAFYLQGEAWKITFDGKHITGLRPSGFKYIYFLVCHENKPFTHMLLNAMDYGVTEVGQQEFSAEPSNIEGTDTFDLIDRQGSQEIKLKIQQLKEELQCAIKAEEKEKDISAIKDDIKSYEMYYKECHASKDRIKKERGQYKTIQTRIGNAITRALEKLEKQGYKQASEHFKKSIKGRYGNTITYSSIDPEIKWHT